MRRRTRGSKPTKIEIIPMIDTMFFLLVFFLLSSLNIINLESLGINLPKESEANVPKIEKVDTQVTVAIKANSFVYVNNRLTEYEDVGKAIIREATTQERKKQKLPTAVLSAKAIEKMSVVISAENGVKHGLVVTCIDSARSQGIQRFAIAVDQRLVNDKENAPAPAPSPAP